MNKKFYITPHINLKELFDAEPNSLVIISEIYPELNKIKNPDIKKSIYESLTLETIAHKTNTPIADIIDKLKKDLNLNVEQFELESVPSWLINENIVKTIDARPMIIAGQHPLQEVKEIIQYLKAGEIFEIITPFVPEPMIDMFKSEGINVFVKKENGMVNTYFCK